MALIEVYLHFFHYKAKFFGIPEKKKYKIHIQEK